MGHKRFALFYLLCGLAAAATQVVANTQSAIPMVGASGAIGGVMGAYIMLYPRVKVHMLFVMVVFITTIRVPAVLMLGYWAFVQFAGGVSSLGATGGGVAFGRILAGLLPVLFWCLLSKISIYYHGILIMDGVSLGIKGLRILFLKIYLL